VYNIAEDYALGIYKLLPKTEFEFSEVKTLAEDAHVWYKEPKFRPSQGERLTGYAPPTSIYNV
jgi:catalase